MVRNVILEKSKLFGLLLSFIGISLLIIGIYPKLFHKQNLIQKSGVVTKSDMYYPAEIYIPSVGIQTDVTKGGFIKGDWILSDDSASYVPTSGKLNEGFNTIVYGHNTLKIFGGLRDIKTGDLIYVRNSKRQQFRYEVFSREDISPKDTRKLSSTEKNVLTLFTCDGLADTSRLMVRGRLVN